MSEWHQVRKGERRPTGLVLAYSYGVTPEARLDAAIHDWEAEASGEISIARWRNGAWRDWKRGWVIHDVTHWMPLPDPPGPDEG